MTLLSFCAKAFWWMLLTVIGCLAFYGLFALSLNWINPYPKKGKIWKKICGYIIIVIEALSILYLGYFALSQSICGEL